MIAVIFFILLAAVLVATIAAFVLLLLTKVGVIEWLQVHGGKFISELACCTFCLSWWACLFLSVLMFVVTMDYTMFVVPFVATPITRHIYG